MANYYVRSGAGGAGTGADWANAFTSIAAALVSATASDTLWVADDHAHSAGAAITWTLPTSEGLKILCVNTHVTEPPTGLVSTPTGSESVGAANALFTIRGYAHLHGLIINGGTNNSTSCDIQIGSTGVTLGISAVQCKFAINSASSGAHILVGPTGNSGNQESAVFFDDCVLSLGNSAQSIFLQYARGRFNGCSLAGTAPTTLFKTSIGTGFDFIIESCSLDGVAYTNLFDQSVATPGRLLIRNSRVSTQTITGTHAGVGASVVQLHNCASGDVHVNLSRQEALGATDVETTLVRSGGGATSYRMTASTSTAYPHLILWSPEASIYNSTTGSAQTLTVEILRDSATNLQDDEVFLEVQYQGTSGYPQAIELTDAISDPLGTPADQTSSSETWTTTGMSNPNKQKLAVTFTAQETGYIHYRVGNSSGSATPIYVDLLGATLA